MSSTKPETPAVHQLARPTAPTPAEPIRLRTSKLNQPDKKPNRKSLEFPQRKIYDAQSVLLDRVKKSYSFDQRCDGEIVAKIVEDRFSGTGSARKVHLISEDGKVVRKGRVNVAAQDGEKTSRLDFKRITSYFSGCEVNPKSSETKSNSVVRLVNGDSVVNLVSDTKAVKFADNSLEAVHGESGVDEVKRRSGGGSEECSDVFECVGGGAGLGGDVREARIAQGTPPLWGSERGVRPRLRPRPPRARHTWHAGYGTLTEEQKTSAKQCGALSGTVSCGTWGLWGGWGGAWGARRRSRPAPLTKQLSKSAAPLLHQQPPHQITVTHLEQQHQQISTSLLSLNNILPRLSASVIPLRRKQRVTSCNDLNKAYKDDYKFLNGSKSNLKKNKDFTKSAGPLLEHYDSSGDEGKSEVKCLRKCETVLALCVEPSRGVNRLRGPCSRCSSLLSLAAGGSRYSLAPTGSGFVPVLGEEDGPDLLCKLCLEDVPSRETTRIQHCGCSFCTKCMQAYAEYEIMNGAYDISCPDSRCPLQGVMLTSEVEALLAEELVDKHRKFRLNHEVSMDAARAFCPRAGCETVCSVGAAGGAGGAGPAAGSSSPSSPQGASRHDQPQSVLCPTCAHNFCSACNNQWHQGMDCAAYRWRSMLEGAAPATDAAAGGAGGVGGDLDTIAAESDLIKWCPMCRVPIEKDEGCAQMMCKRCKHVFCWYCLASLDDDFLLRHYDKGPCKNKLGHSRASVIWHRVQVVGIFAGFGLLLLVASPLLLLAAPCIVCCKCRLCSSQPDKEDALEDQVDADADGEDKELNTPSVE